MKLEEEFTSFEEFFNTKDTYEIEDNDQFPFKKFHNRYKLFNVSKETFMNYNKPLTELQRIKERNFRFLDSTIFGVILSKDADIERF